MTQAVTRGLAVTAGPRPADSSKSLNNATLGTLADGPALYLMDCL